MINKTQYQALAIGQVALSKDNSLLFDYGKITARDASQERNIFTLASLSYSIKSNLKLWLFCGNLLNGNHIKRMVRSEVRTEKVTKTVTKLLKTEQVNLYRNSTTFTKAIKVFEDFPDVRKSDFELAKSDNYLSSVFANFSRQALITQAEKLLLSFLTFASICSISSWGKRISLRLVNLVSFAIFKLYLIYSIVRTVYTTKRDKKSIDLYGHDNIYCADRLISDLNDNPMYWHTRGYLTKPLEGVMIMANRYDSAHLRVKQSQDPNSKKHLPTVNYSGYINIALAKSKVRISTLHILLVTHDAPSVFFCVNACAYLSKIFTSMVALVGRLKGRLVSSSASSANPVNVTAKEFSTSRGDYINHLLEAVTMTTIPNTLTPKKFKFYNPVTSNIISVIATNEAQARDEISPCCVFIFRQPLAMGVCHE